MTDPSTDLAVPIPLADPPKRGPARVLRHAALIVLVDAVCLVLLAWILPGFGFIELDDAVLTAIGIGLVNTFLWPILSRLTLKLSVLTLGIFGILLNGAVVGVAIILMPWVRIDGFFEAFLIAILLGFATAIASSVLAIEEDSTWYLSRVKRNLGRRSQVENSEVPGIVFLEIDGLAHDILRRALSNGNAPNMARWVRQGLMDLQPWETDWSSQTGACQAGILHGNNSEMPAFRWWDRVERRNFVTNHPRDAAELEARQSNGMGLLHSGGASRANILSGDATYSQLTMSTVLKPRGAIGRDYAAYFSRPYAAIRTASFAVAEIIAERISALRQRRAGIEPRINRGWVYAVMRTWATVIQLDLQVSAVIADILAGRPAIYTTFLAYDEVAHHSGIERPESLAVLRRVDNEIARIVKAAALAPRPYHFVVLSDHGQSQGATFLQRYGETLEDVVNQAAGVETGEEPADEHRDEAQAYLLASLAEASREDSIAGRTVKVTTGSSVEESLNTTGEQADANGEAELPEINVMASGCLGIISFPRLTERATLESIEGRYPDLITNLREHEGIGFILVRTESGSDLVLGRAGSHDLTTGEVTGKDPLEDFGPNAASHVRRTSSFANCPDILVNSTYWSETDEVAAFEELVGSHGGLGGTQSHPFVLHPSNLAWPDDPVVGAESIYRIFTGWQRILGQATGPAPEGTSKSLASTP